MKYKAVIFDLDGTLLNTLGDLKTSVNYALNEFKMPERELSEVRCFVGNGIGKLIERSVPENTDKETCDAVTEVFKSHYSLHCNDSTTPYSGINALLKKLCENGVKCAVLSNKVDSAVKALCNRYFKDLLSDARGECEGIGRKPSPDGIYMILKALDISKEDAVFVGDSEVDIQTAANANIDLIAVDWGFRDKIILENAGAERIVSDVSELERCIL